MFNQFTRTITVFKKTKPGCTKQIIDGVFYDDIKAASLESRGQGEANSIKVVIPLKSMPKGYEIREGDYIVKGAVTADYADVSMMRQSEAAHLVTSCDHKDYGDTPNLLILGK